MPVAAVESPSESLVGRARGMMVGIGVGNLLGIPWEGKSREFIQQRCPGGVREITATDSRPDDDDLAQAILLADACTECDRLDTDDLMRRFWEWGEANGAGIGGLTTRVLAEFGGERPRRALRHYCRQLNSGRFAEPPNLAPRPPQGAAARDAARLAWEDSGRRSASNGSVMRCGPVALRWMHDEAELARNSVISAAVTHWDWRCVWSTLLADFAIASCLRGEPVEADALVQRASGALGLWRGRLQPIVSAGGDTDTNAAPAGAVLGARFGLQGIPQRWRNRTSEIRSWEPTSVDWIDRHPLEHYADRLLNLTRG